MRSFQMRFYRSHVSGVHPHAHQIGMTAVILGLIGIPMGFTLVIPTAAVLLGLWAIMLSRHPAPGMDASPEGWCAIAAGLMGLAFGGSHLWMMWRL